ncbi:hypothetical protein CMI47_23555 [Candidatus Pacearchaeota archaeon]|nr:hypothetical protein [Candidatus Pacearchaeota archaeon]
MTFNLSKHSQLETLDAPMPEPALDSMEFEVGEETLMRDEDNVEKIKDHAHLRDTLLSMTVESANDAFVSKVEDNSVVDEESGSIVNPKQTIKDGIQRFFSPGLTPEDQLDISDSIFDSLPLSFKSEEYSQPTMTGNETEVVASIVSDTDLLISKIASSLSKLKSNDNNQVFNLSKTAQAHAFQHNMFLYGPEQTRISPFTGDIQSGLHLIEQNKGFGLKIDDILDIDFEAIWRGNIMDKYSRPYKNEKGEWVGGYINKRFEVNQWVPEGNNLQIAPNRRGRPYMPEYGNYEARFEAARGQKDRLSDPLEIGEIKLSSSNRVFNLSKKKDS